MENDYHYEEPPEMLSTWKILIGILLIASFVGIALYSIDTRTAEQVLSDVATARAESDQRALVERIGLERIQVCTGMIEQGGENSRIAFFPDSDTHACMDLFAGQGWRIVGTRRANDGNGRWGQEVTFQR